MVDVKEHSIELCQRLGVEYWESALMGPRMRGSKVRVTPHKDMMLDRGYLKQVVVMGDLRTLLFDSLYLEHYKAVTGIDYVLQWTHKAPVAPQTAPNVDSSQLILNKLAEFLTDGKIALSGSNPRHSLLIKFKSYVEGQSNARN